jgi:hypothetical protein
MILFLASVIAKRTFDEDHEELTSGTPNLIIIPASMYSYMLLATMHFNELKLYTIR